MTRPRDEWEHLTVEARLIPGNLTRKTGLLVAADPDTMSGKAAQARDHGIPIVTESAFERMLAEL